MEIVKSFIDSIFKIYLGNPGLLIFTIILWIIVFLLKIYYPKFRGFMGEFWVKKELGNLPKNDYIVLNDIMIRDQNGTHQIDHIVLSNSAVFVIEMKNYYGLIKGSEYDDKWIQYLGRKVNYFMNPIHQNYSHVKALSNLLKLDESYFISIICFSNQVKLNVKCKSIVTQLGHLLSKIGESKPQNLNLNMLTARDIIVSSNITNNKEKRQHINNIKDKIQVDNQLASNMICPKCGNHLIERNGKYGKFIGCSNFPKCRYIRK